MAINNFIEQPRLMGRLGRGVPPVPENRGRHIPAGGCQPPGGPCRDTPRRKAVLRPDRARYQSEHQRKERYMRDERLETGRLATTVHRLRKRGEVNQDITNWTANLVEGVLLRHRPTPPDDYGDQWCRFDQQGWPCPDAKAAIAVLDRIGADA